MLSPLTFMLYFFFFFNDTATPEIYTLSLHDALPISSTPSPQVVPLAPVDALRDSRASAARSWRPVRAGASINSSDADRANQISPGTLVASAAATNASS